MTVPVVASRAKTETSSSIAAPLSPPSPPPKGTRRIVILSGDNIGPEVTGQARRVLDVVFGLRAQRHGVRVHMVEGLLGGAAIDAEGTALPRATIELIDHEETAAILLGCVGGPQWPAVAGMPRPEEGRTERAHLFCHAYQ